MGHESKDYIKKENLKAYKCIPYKMVIIKYTLWH